MLERVVRRVAVAIRPEDKSPKTVHHVRNRILAPLFRHPFQDFVILLVQDSRPLALRRLNRGGIGDFLIDFRELQEHLPFVGQKLVDLPQLVGIQSA